MGIIKKYGVSLWLLLCALILKGVNIKLESSIVSALIITTLILCGLSLISLQKKKQHRTVKKTQEPKIPKETTKNKKDKPPVATKKRNRNMEI